MRKCFFVACMLCGACGLMAQSVAERYLTPSHEAMPRVWWHWMNGNITKEGIRKDLLWMNEIGVAGFHNFDAGFVTPQIVEKRLAYMTPEWKDAFNYALTLADSLQMEVGIASSPGWSVTGGPWVSQEDAMKKLVWSEVELEGGQVFRGELPQPPSVAGAYQDLARYPNNPEKDAYYKDIAVLAVQLDAPTPKPEVTTDPDKRWIVLHYAEPQTIQSVYAVAMEGNQPECLECSDDGVNYKLVSQFIPQHTLVKSFNVPATTARYFRVSGQKVCLKDLRLQPDRRINMFTEKAGFYTDNAVNYPFLPISSEPMNTRVIDLTKQCRQGKLTWKVPQGSWKVMRFGYSLTGKENSPASEEATGLEVDKMDADAVKRYYKQYLGMYQDASENRLGKVISHLMIDSYEAGGQSWTTRMPQEFRKRRGYDLIPWLPVLSGMVVHSELESERFLFDWQQTMSELTSENHYNIVHEILAPYGMKRYNESHGQNRLWAIDGMDLKRTAEIPMSEFWIWGRDKFTIYEESEADIHEAASVGHIYGQNLCAVEAFTMSDHGGEFCPWGPYPGNIKYAADNGMACGLNRFVIHCSVHQPSDDHVPGLSLGPYGQWFTRHETWASEAKPWIDYLTRSSHLLQQGKFVADVAYFYGENTNTNTRFDREYVHPLTGFSYDFVNPTILLDVLKLEGTHLTTDTGMDYSVLVLDYKISRMSIPILRRLKQIAEAGVFIFGNEPTNMANLKGDEHEFKQLVDAIWHAGRQNVFPFDDLDELSAKTGIAKDADMRADNKSRLRFVHRRTPDGEIYWVANISGAYLKVDASFRIDGKKPMVYHADTGVLEEVSYKMLDNNRTVVQLNMLPDDAQFVLFMDDTNVRQNLVPTPIMYQWLALQGAWQVKFQPNRGAPEGVVEFSKLKSYTESQDKGVKYFSGIAEYGKHFEVNQPIPDGELVLDLGNVRNMAHVWLNGKDLGLLWKAPYRVKVTGALREGDNELTIHVINSWPNRLIGDAQPDVERKITYTTYEFFNPKTPLLPAGLLGPVVFSCASVCK